ncbi:hypothetical protein KK083_11195 [Fulvivirgaceae bacterium PWU4]|uniref:Lipoprotein n=1 Tax=Chryseosolibacter histidini TaxID=2782349 RepID=A0AAP2DJI4_9BACT|nr:hypothetical protein [Chryseosolibacter histidini]MBT1697445.1 hypothetical protein [Chryseosolibacter histidini]
MRKHINSFGSMILFATLVAAWASCADEEAPGFSPSIDLKATYSFKLTPPTGGTVQYNLTDITRQASKEGADRWIFLLKGKDKTTKSEVYISGLAGTRDSYLNIFIAPAAGASSFYKDCNNFTCQATAGKDTKGSFVQMNYTNQCVTPTLASERSMTIVQCQVELSPITFYVQD